MNRLQSDGWLESTDASAEATGADRIPARPVYDSSRDLPAKGARSAGTPSQALYEAENYSLDLHLSQERAASRMVLVGQIADRSEPSRRLAAFPVSLESGSGIAASSESNQLGEFYFEYDAKQRMRLRIPIAGRSIEVPLPRLRKSEEFTFQTDRRSSGARSA